MNGLASVLLFTAIAVAFFVDIVIAVSVPRLYWGTSIPVFLQKLALQRQPSFDDLALVKSENRRWTVRWLARQDEPFRIGFRERAFGLTTLYTPLIHGELRLAQTDRVLLVGRLNWYPIAFSAWVITFATTHGRLDFLLGLLIVMGLLFAIQRYRFSRFARRSLDIVSQGG